MYILRNIKSNYEYNSLLFEFINPNENDKLSIMKGTDLQELLYRLDMYYLELRKSLGFNENVTFGLELEFENAIRNRIEKKLEEQELLRTWKVVNDGSLIKGAEINSPILTDNLNNWMELKNVCSIVKENAVIGKHSAGHIHIGTQVLGDNKISWLNFIKLWSIYENIIFRFLYGEELTGRKSISEYAKPISRKLWNDYMYLKEYENNEVMLNFFVGVLHRERYQAVNFSNVCWGDKFCRNNTIEFRCPNGTLEPVIWQNNVNLLVNILNYSKSSNFDDDLVMRRRSINLDEYSHLKWYDEIYLEQSLELADMLFDNNLDKVYFLRQYLKSFQIGKTKIHKVKKFIKK